MERRKGISSKRIASTKALRQERTWLVREHERMTVWLKERGGGRDGALQAMVGIPEVLGRAARGHLKVFGR